MKWKEPTFGATPMLRGLTAAKRTPSLPSLYDKKNNKSDEVKKPERKLFHTKPARLPSSTIKKQPFPRRQRS